MRDKKKAITEAAVLVLVVAVVDVVGVCQTLIYRTTQPLLSTINYFLKNEEKEGCTQSGNGYL